jgi:hypothetical protein
MELEIQDQGMEIQAVNMEHLGTNMGMVLDTREAVGITTTKVDTTMGGNSTVVEETVIVVAIEAEDTTVVGENITSLGELKTFRFVQTEVLPA